MVTLRHCYNLYLRAPFLLNEKDMKLLVVLILVVGLGCARTASSPTPSATPADSQQQPISAADEANGSPVVRRNVMPTPGADDSSIAQDSLSDVKPSSSAGVTFRRRTPFVPLDNPEFVSADESDAPTDADLVLGLEWNGEPRAYPVSMMRFHHIANDTVGGRPFLISY